MKLQKVKVAKNKIREDTKYPITVDVLTLLGSMSPPCILFSAGTAAAATV